MDGLEHRRKIAGRVQVCARRQTDSSPDCTRQVSNDVAEEIVGDNYIKSRGIRDEKNRRRVDVQIVNRHIGKIECNRINDSLPQRARKSQDVRLVNESEPARTIHCRIKGETYDALNSVRGIDGGLGRDFVRCSLPDHASVSNVRTFRPLAHNDEVHFSRLSERASHTRINGGGSKIHVMVEREAQLEQ